MDMFDQDTFLGDEVYPSQVVTDLFPTAALWENHDGLTSAGCQVPINPTPQTGQRENMTKKSWV